jgi:hypothetical protein
LEGRSIPQRSIPKVVNWCGTTARFGSGNDEHQKGLKWYSFGEMNGEMNGLKWVRKWMVKWWSHSFGEVGRHKFRPGNMSARNAVESLSLGSVSQPTWPWRKTQRAGFQRFGACRRAQRCGCCHWLNPLFVLFKNQQNIIEYRRFMEVQ